MSYKVQSTMFFLVIEKLMSRYPGTLCMKIHPFKIRKCFAHYISLHIRISNILLISYRTRILEK